MCGEGKFSGVLAHQGLEAARGDHFAKSGVDGFGAGADAEKLASFVGEMGVEADGRELRGHERLISCM